jgi:hypothetical protein
MEKKCCRCGVVKSTTEFYKCNKAKDKLQSSCRDCKKQFSNNRNNEVKAKSKVCIHCKVEKPTSEFRMNRSSSDGLRHECKDCKYEMDREYRISNWDTLYVKKKKYADDNRESLNKSRMRLYYSNVNKYRSRSLFYIQARRNSQPKWTIQFKDEWDKLNSKRLRIEELTGNKYNIDHIIPVMHPDVCGLSVPWNYQLLTKQDNVRKSNQFDGTYDNESWRS